MAATDIVIVSNRGPLAFTLDDAGRPVARRGAGGLVSGIGPLVAGTSTIWIAAALSDGDRAAAADGVIEAEGFRVRTLALDPEDFRLAYDVVCNATLWFAHHHLFELAVEPVFDAAWWAGYVAQLRAIAERSPGSSSTPSG